MGLSLHIVLQGNARNEWQLGLRQILIRSTETSSVIGLGVAVDLQELLFEAFVNLLGENAKPVRRVNSFSFISKFFTIGRLPGGDRGPERKSLRL